MAKTCIFCGAKKRQFTGEHVMPEWVAKALGVGRLNVLMQYLDDPPRRWQSVGSFGSTVNRVCRECNEGWMSVLEADAKPILLPLIQKGAAVRLAPDHQVVIASWLWKIAIVQEARCPLRYFIRTERLCLLRGDAPPLEDVGMWLARYRGPLKATLRGGPSRMSTPTGDQIPGFEISLALGHFAAQLLCFRPWPGLGTVDPTSNHNFRPMQVQVWPERQRAVQWPPNGPALDGPLFNLWHRRFHSADLNARSIAQGW